jgi:hypothetical protein
MRQAQTHTWAPGTSPKLKSLQDLSIRVNPKVTKEVMHHFWSVSRWMLAFLFVWLQCHPSIA